MPAINVVPVAIVRLLFTVNPPMAVLLLPFDRIRLSYAMPFIFWVPTPLKLTVLGVDEDTFNVPAVIVIKLAIPNVEFDDNCKEVPFRVTLKRFAVPLKVEVPVNVAVPAEADKLPPTESPVEMEKLTAVVTEPVTDNTAIFFVPTPEIVLEAPLMVSVPVLVVKVPLTNKLPVRLRDVEVLTVPAIVRLSNEIPEPLMVLAVPVIDSVPPNAWLSDPGPVVARFPLKVIRLLGKLMSDAAAVRLLKF